MKDVVCKPFIKMKDRFGFIPAIIIIVSTFVIIACVGFMFFYKAGEKEAVEYVKTRCSIPDSFVKTNYVVYKDAKLARIDFKAKNKLGVEIPHRAYFNLLDNNHIVYIETEDVENQVLDFLEKNHLSDFEVQVKNYKKLSMLIKMDYFDVKFFIDNLEDLDVSNYYSVYGFKERAKKYNSFLRKFKIYYNSLPNDFKDFLEQEIPGIDNMSKLKYEKVVLTGDYGDWDFDWKHSDVYPE